MSESNAAASIVDRDGNKRELSLGELGLFIKENYGSYDFPFKQNFFDYHDSHVMAEVRAKLKAGLDNVSCDYLDRFEYLLSFQRVADKALLKTDMFWTDTDKALLERNREIVEGGKIPFLKQVNQDFSTSYTNLYGLYDVLPVTKSVSAAALQKSAADDAKAQQSLAAVIEAAGGIDADGNVSLSYMERINGKAVIDAGGFIGDTIVLFKDLFERSKIYSFEPVKKNYDFMCNFVKDIIATGRIVPIQKGLGKEPGVIRFSGTRTTADATASSYYDFDIPELYEEAEVITLDSFATENKLEVGLIKIDVEGAEIDIVNGALETIKRDRPLLVIAIYHNAPEFYELKPYLESLNLGYKFCVRRSNICNPSTDLVLVAYQE